MIRSSLCPRYQITNNGVWIQDEVIDTFSQELKDHYGNGTPTHLSNDKYHYDGFFKTVGKSLTEKKYDAIIAFGGGMPKFESYLNCDKIYVIDGLANIFKQHLDLFRTIYKYPGSVEFVELKFNSDVISRFPYSDYGDNILITFIHFLEHQLLGEHIQILGKLPHCKDVMIYGPNITSARNNGWVHFNNIPDHHTFMPFKVMSQYLTEFNYEIYNQFEYSDDLFFYFNTRGKC